jgi:hypothetical protein
MGKRPLVLLRDVSALFLEAELNLILFRSQADTGGRGTWRAENQGCGGKSATVDAGTGIGYNLGPAGY